MFAVLTTEWSLERHRPNSNRRVEMTAIEFMRFGSYRKLVKGQTVIGDANTAVFFNAGEDFHVSHPHGTKNAGTTIRLSPDALHGLLREIDPPATNSSTSIIRATHVFTPPSCHSMQQTVVTYLTTSESVDPLLVQESLIQLVRTSVSKALEFQRSSGRIRTAGRKSLMRERVDATREYLMAAWPTSCTLDEIAVALECSPWYLAHEFRAEVGIPIHRYLNRLRLRHALAQIASGSGTDDLSRLALSCGFSSHSHFSAAFHRELGQNPSQVRKGVDRALLEEYVSLEKRSRLEIDTLKH